MSQEAWPETLDVALNESTWLGITFDRERHQITLAFDALTLPSTSGGEGHEGVTLVLLGVTRIVASLRRGRWDDKAADVVPISEDDFASAFEVFGSPVYGWKFFDQPDESWDQWRDRLSLDTEWQPRHAAHSLDLFQEGRMVNQHLDFRVWFDELTVYDSNGRAIALSEFAEGGVRWWKGLRSGDARASGRGIYPLKGDDDAP